MLLFGAKKLPELARGSGQALRIFKAETKGLKSTTTRPTKTPSSARSTARSAEPEEIVPQEHARRPPPDRR